MKLFIKYDNGDTDRLCNIEKVASVPNVANALTVWYHGCSTAYRHYKVASFIVS